MVVTENGELAEIINISVTRSRVRVEVRLNASNKFACYSAEQLYKFNIPHVVVVQLFSHSTITDIV
jgi:hypothetical protein